MRAKCITPSPTSSTEPNPAPFPYQDYQRARQSLYQVLQRPTCFYAMVLGKSGMGKTSLFDDLQASLDHHRHHIVYLSSSLVSAVGIVHTLAQHLHVTPRRFYLETVHIIGDAIAAQSNHLLLWIDEADRVAGHTLQEIRMVAESRPRSNQLFSLVLSGLPLLGAKLDAPDLFPLKRRIVLRWTLAGLRREELADFLHHRFGAEDAARLPDEAYDELFERTQACPALIDNIVRCALSQTPSQTPINPEVFHAILNIAPF